MTSVTDPAGHALQDLLEQQYARYTTELAHLMACVRSPDRGGYDPYNLQALVAWARQRVADTAQALRRMSDGTYGVCVRCRSEIPVVRLMACPEALHCSPCLQNREP